MTNVILCCGTYARTAYYVMDDCLKLYSIEELCYYLYHNAYLLDDRFVTRELGAWIKDELGLSDLGESVTKLAGKADSLTKLVCELKEQIGYYTDEEWDNLCGDIGRNNKMSVEERRKCRADEFLIDGKYVLAMDEYEFLIRDLSYDQVKMRARIYHNMGICACKMFMFERGAGYFEKAYETYANTESYVSMLSAMKLYMNNKEYLEYLSQHKESYEDSLEVENKLEMLKLDWVNQPAKRFLDGISAKKEQSSDFYDGIESLAIEVKEEYREHVFRNRG